MLNELNAALPNLPDNVFLNSDLDSIVLSQPKVEFVFKTLVTGKAAGPNGLSNRILRELSFELSLPFCCLFNQFLRASTFSIVQRSQCLSCP